VQALSTEEESNISRKQAPHHTVAGCPRSADAALDGSSFDGACGSDIAEQCHILSRAGFGECLGNHCQFD